jgi:hypothetical protein
MITKPGPPTVRVDHTSRGEWEVWGRNHTINREGPYV